jgi:hypothetical protein
VITPETQRLIEAFTALTEVDFRRALEANLADELLVETGAFRSPALAERSLSALRVIIDQSNTRLDRRSNENNRDWESSQRRWRDRAGQERRLLTTIVAGLRAQAGFESCAPSARGRAARELQSLRPVEYLNLVRKHEALIKVERKAARAANRRSGTRSDVTARPSGGFMLQAQASDPRPQRHRSRLLRPSVAPQCVRGAW